MYFLLIHLAVYCNSDFHSLAASKVYSLFLAFISLSIMCLYRCVCSAFIPLVSAEYLRSVACSLDPYLFKYFLCCILFLFYSWNFIFWHIRYYPRTFGYLILFFHPYVSVCILSTDLFSCSMIFFIPVLNLLMSSSKAKFTSFTTLFYLIISFSFYLFAPYVHACCQSFSL